MARVYIKEAKVERLLGDKGFKASTEYQTRSGDRITEYWTIWGFNDVREGDIVNIQGVLSVKIDAWEDKETGEPKQAAGAHVNLPKVELVTQGAILSGATRKQDLVASDEIPF